MVTPIEDHTKLSVDPKGLDVLRRITGLVVPVVIIGPYRSGKSYTLNQLISVGCSASHARQRQPTTSLLSRWWNTSLTVLKLMCR